MWFYYGLLIYVLILSVVLCTYRKSQKAKLIYVILSLGLPAFLAMFRSEYVGNDTSVYASLFYKIASSANYLNYAHRYEIGYIYLNKVLSSIFDNHQILLVITSGYIYFVFGRFIYKYSKSPWLSVFLFFTMRYFDMSMSVIRQMLAIATLILSYDYIIEKKPLKFYLTVLIACLFHVAAIVFLPAYHISKFKISNKFTITMLIFTGVSFYYFDKILTLGLLIFPRFTYYLGGTYLDGKVRSGTIAALLIYLVILVVSELSCTRFYLKKFTDGKKCVNIITTKTKGDEVQSMFILTSCVLLFISIRGSILSRLSDIYGVFSLIYLPNALQKIRQKEIKGFILIATVVLFTVYLTVVLKYRPEWQSSYPYSFFWNH